MDTTAVAEYLGFSPVFAPLSASERADLASRMRPRRFARGEVIFHRDDPAGHVFLIAAGTVKISVEEEGGQEVVIALARGGDVFGELALFDDAARSATVTALTETTAYTLASADFRAVLQHNAAAMWELLGLLAKRIRRSTGHIEDLVFLDLPGRVAKCLIDQDELLGANGVVALTQEDVASFVGATRVAVNRVLVDLERRGALQLGRGSLRIVDAELLKKEIRY
ncbi:MAG TPA: Crp/Fnr family transcriptional regulator [Candidatus Limnocylindrales bacterium]|nr:Crp/Fnr family transcriptional regulator [Candidatus Limnocylindrales bacterium]